MNLPSSRPGSLGTRLLVRRYVLIEQMLGYSTEQLTNPEKWITVILLIIVILLLMASINKGHLTNDAMAIFNFTISALSVSLLFPKILHDLNVNLGNLYVSSMWLVAIGTLCIISTSTVSFVPLLMFMYFHLMRTIHFLFTGLIPAFSAHRWTLNSFDKHALRNVRKSDLNFMILYMSLPLLVLGILAWFWSLNSFELVNKT